MLKYIYKYTLQKDSDSIISLVKLVYSCRWTWSRAELNVW